MTDNPFAKFAYRKGSSSKKPAPTAVHDEKTARNSPHGLSLVADTQKGIANARTQSTTLVKKRKLNVGGGSYEHDAYIQLQASPLSSSVLAHTPSAQDWRAEGHGSRGSVDDFHRFLLNWAERRTSETEPRAAFTCLVAVILSVQCRQGVRGELGHVNPNTNPGPNKSLTLGI